MQTNPTKLVCLFNPTSSTWSSVLWLSEVQMVVVIHWSKNSVFIANLNEHIKNTIGKTCRRACFRFHGSHFRDDVFVGSLFSWMRFLFFFPSCITTVDDDGERCEFLSQFKIASVSKFSKYVSNFWISLSVLL
eukprot:TRINITY_DN3739_c0_g1_i13.p1 TRINITY_DN3739_c0_g1~~TRINITY_DN3739_c0_g1_i13.p1  ORF type:complete len:133 (+),score=31.41 TRINITY_DN3739_c0_g1_i13:415-813(+)